MFSRIDELLRTRKNRRYVYKWKNCVSNSADGRFTISRKVDEQELFYDLYWYVLPVDKSKYVESVYRRVSKTGAIDVIKLVEAEVLPDILTKLSTAKKR